MNPDGPSKKLALRFKESVVISDPCYERETWCAGVLTTKPGKWRGWVVYQEGRVASLHCEYAGREPVEGNTTVEPLPFEVGVDSGQAGVFADALYPKERHNPAWERFYNKCCGTTLTEKMWGTVGRRGIVSSTGYGDGGYSGEATFDADHRAVAISIYFMLDE